jgi:tetratricopeptide (TPR) repeat protein
LSWIKESSLKAATDSLREIDSKWSNQKFLMTEKLAKAYQQQEKYLDAATCYKALVEKRGAKINDLINLSVVLFKAGEMSDSLTYARQAYSKDSQNPTTSKVFLECLISTNHAQEAMDLAQEKLKDSPTDNDYKVALAQSKRLLGDWDGSIEILSELANTQKELRFKLLLADAYGETDSGKALPIYASALASGGIFSPIFYYNLSLHYLRTHQFKEGWRLYEYGLDREIGLYGRKVPYNLKGMFRADLVDNPDPCNWTIVCSEQGIGDQLIFLSAIEEAKKDFPNMILVCEGRMASIIKRSFPDLQLMTSGKIGDGAFNVIGQNLGYVPLGSMLAKYRPDTEAFLANKKPYISVDGDLYHQYREQLKLIANGRKILGISWQSHVAANTAKIKSTAFADWLGVFDKDTLVVNLQYGNSDAEQNLVKVHGLDMVSFNHLDFTKDLEHWLALSAACDGITCISTSLVHFAGACGQKVSVVMPYNQGHWSVGVTDTESIIYSNVRLFRRENSESNASLVHRAANHIKKDLI